MSDGIRDGRGADLPPIADLESPKDMYVQALMKTKGPLTVKDAWKVTFAAFDRFERVERLVDWLSKSKRFMPAEVALLAKTDDDTRPVAHVVLTLHARGWDVRVHHGYPNAIPVIHDTDVIIDCDGNLVALSPMEQLNGKA